MPQQKQGVWRDKDDGSLWTKAPNGDWMPYSSPSQAILQQAPVEASEPGAFQRSKGTPLERATWDKRGEPEPWSEALKQVPPTILASFGIDPNSEHGVTRQMLSNLGQIPGQLSQAMVSAAQRHPNLPGQALLPGVAYHTMIEPIQHAMKQGAQDVVAGFKSGDHDQLVRGATQFLSAAGQAYLMRESPTTVEDAADLPKASIRAYLGIGKAGEENMLSRVAKKTEEATAANTVRTGQQFTQNLGMQIAKQLGDELETKEPGKPATGLRPTLRKMFQARWDELRETMKDRTAEFGPIDKARAVARDTLKTESLRSQFDSALDKAGFPEVKHFIDTPEGPRAIPRTGGAPVDMSYAKLQEMYTQLNDAMYGGSGPEFDQLQHALEPVRRSLSNVLEGMNDAAGNGDKFRELRSQYADFKTNFDDRGAPIRRLIEAKTTPKRVSILKEYAFDDAKLAGVLSKYDRMAGGKFAGLGERLREATRHITEMPRPQAYQKIPKTPPLEDFRRAMVQMVRGQQLTPSRFDISFLGTPTAPIRRSIGAALIKPFSEDWLAQGPTTNFLNSAAAALRTPPTFSRPKPEEGSE